MNGEGERTSAWPGSSFGVMHGGEMEASMQQRAFPITSQASKEQVLNRLREPEFEYVHASEPPITTTLCIGTESRHPGKEMEGENPYGWSGSWFWGPKIDCPPDVVKEGRDQGGSGLKRKRPVKGVACKKDLGSSLGLGHGSAPIDIRSSHAPGGYSAGSFCVDVDSPTALSLGQVDHISGSPDSQGSLLGSSVRSRVSDSFLSIGSPVQGTDGLLYSRNHLTEGGEAVKLGSGAHLYLGKGGDGLVEGLVAGGQNFEGVRRGGTSRGGIDGRVILELGPAGQHREGHNLSTMRESKSHSDMILELGVGDHASAGGEGMKSGGGHVPVLDEGSSSARWSKGGGFMPAFLMANSPSGLQYGQRQAENVVNFYGQSPDVHQNLLERDLNRMEQDLSMSMRASTSCTTSTSGASGLSEKVSKICKFKGCGKGARGASGLCIAHGGGRRCEKQGCNKGAEGRTVYCKAHGGGRRCQKLGCTKSAEGKTDYCIGHGGGRRCSTEGCTKAARGRSGLCIRHGGGKRCQVDGCTKSAEGHSGLCISHGGGRRCQFVGCTKGAQGSTMFCKAHGGGKRCMIAGCNKGAEGSTPLCKGHGGGKRCMYDGGGICTKSVHGGTAYCVAHGGGKRCAVEGCSKSARGRTDYCVRHGGGKRCKAEGCGKSAQGSTDFCKAHGGGKRCQWGVEGSPWVAYAGMSWNGGLRPALCERFARGKTGLCATHSALVQDSRVHAGSVIGPGLSPGLFRGLVSGSAQSQGRGNPSGSISVGGESDRGVASRDEVGDQAESSRQTQSSSENDMSEIESGKESAWAPSGGDAVDSTMESDLTMSGSRHDASTSGHSFGPGAKSMTSEMVAASAAPLTIGADELPSKLSTYQASLIPPQVLVPLSMQNLYARRSVPTSKSESSLSKVFTSTTDDGAFNMSSLSLPEGRVHGGGLMRMLARDPNLGNEIMERTSLQLSSSKYFRYQTGNSFVPPSGGAQAEEDGGHSSSPNVDIGQFLTTE